MPETVHDLALQQLGDELERLRALLLAHVDANANVDASTIQASSWTPDADPRTPLDQLCALFGLDPFERDVLLVCAGCELDAPFAALCRSAAVDPSRARPTLGLMLACLPGANWSALAPYSPLRRWQLVQVHADRVIADAELTIDEPVLHFLLDGVFWDPELAGLVDPLAPEQFETHSQRALIDRILGVWTRASGQPSARLPLIQLVGPDPGAGLELVAALAAQIRRVALRIDAGLLPSSLGELQTKLHAWQRTSRIEAAIGVVDAASQAPDRVLASEALARWLEAAEGPTVLLTRTRRSPGARTWVTLELQAPRASEQAELWQAELAHSVPELQHSNVAPVIEQLVSTFDLAAGRIRSACADARGMLRSTEMHGWADALWHACRIQARPDLDALAQRFEGDSTWTDLCVDPQTTAMLQMICDQVRQRATVHGRWGMGGKSRRGLGIAALFSGSSGTGKTMAAEVVGNELRLDVYRIDLSAVVSKYIGETEKNLARVFDSAEGSGVILLFDEADALFGKRTEVKDSHDRHANVEIGYLLQRMEAYRGLAILTTNLREDLDQAFLRRLRFIVEFPHPSSGERQRLWQRALTCGAPLAAIDYTALAGLPLTGGQIRNIAINAAFAAAKLERAIDSELLREAVRHEFEKNGQRLSNAELLRLEPGPARGGSR